MTNKVCGQHKYQHETDHKSLDPNPPHHWKNKLMKEAEETHRDPSQIKNQASFWKRIQIKKKEKEKIAWNHQEAKTWDLVKVRPHWEARQFFSNIDFFFPLISNIKSFTGTKYILTTSCRNWKACVGLFFFFSSNPTQYLKKKKKILTEQRNDGRYDTDHIEMHPLWLSSRQDKTSTKLWLKHEQSWRDYQTGKKHRKGFFLLSFGSGQ